MKKLLGFTTMLVLSIGLISCSAKTPNITNEISNNKATNPKITVDTPNKGTITDTTDTSFLPPYMNNLRPDITYPPSKESRGYTKTIYTIKNTKITDVFNKYQIILKNDGWTIYHSASGSSISAKKVTHDVTITIQKSGSNVKLTVVSK